MKLRINMFGFIIILFVILIGLKIYYDSDVFNLRCIVSTVDGKKYCVRERKNVTKASNLLARTTEKLEYLVENLGQRYPDRDNVKRMVENFNPTKKNDNFDILIISLWHQYIFSNTDEENYNDFVKILNKNYTAGFDPFSALPSSTSVR